MNNKKIQDLKEEILKLKERENALILAHFYVDIDIQEIADEVGDSLYLAKVAKEKADEFDYIIEAAVYFMAETAVILNPEKDVYIAGLEAFCPMAKMCPANTIVKYKKKNPNIPTVLYVNTTAEAKSKADVMCTSSNALKICTKCNNEKVLFGPDKNLGLWVKRESGLVIIPVPENGNCYVHKMFTVDNINKMKADYPNAIVLAHPECDPEVLEIADVVGSTKIIYDYCKDSSEENFIIATEKGLVDRLNKEFGADKNFFSALETAVCKGMKKNNLSNIYDILKDRPEKYKVIVKKEIADKARIGINKMFEFMK